MLPQRTPLSVCFFVSCPHLSLTALCNYYRDRNDVDVSAVYHQLLDTYKSSDTESDVNVEAKPGPSSSRNADSLGTITRRHQEQQKRRMSRRRTAAAPAIPTDWRRECRDLLEMLWSCEDSTPFRLPFTQHIYHKRLLYCCNQHRHTSFNVVLSNTVLLQC